MMVDPMFMIVLNSRSLLAAVTPTAVAVASLGLHCLDKIENLNKLIKLKKKLILSNLGLLNF